MKEEDQLKIIQAKLKITDKRTAKQILAHKELCEDIIKRDIISEQELVEEYQIPQSHLKGLKQQGKLSFFASTGEMNKTSRGSKTYYFLDEVKDLFGYNIRYNKSFTLKNKILSKMIVDISSKLLTQKETDMLEMFLIKNISVDEIAEEYVISKVRAAEVIGKASRRMIGRVHMLQKMFADYNTALEYQTENKLLKKQNTELYRKFLRDKENQAIKDLNSNTNVQHFVKYGYDIKDLTKEFYQFNEHLSVRATGCLRNGGIKNLDDLLSNWSKWDLIRMRNMGTKTLNEICDWLEDKYNWTLRYKD
jgi:predicted DNA-binding protein YlxM (UPF0122 family)/DNA-binding Xre family transcriptional regulator